MFWDNFYSLCESKNTTPNAVCKQLNLSTATATHWKNGAMPNGDVLLNIANLLDCSVDYLLGRTNEPNGNIQIGAKTPNYGTTANEMIAVFNGLRFEDKVKVMSLVAELSEKKEI